MITFNTIHSNGWTAVKRIYEEGIATGNATFQESATDWDEWNNNHLQHSRIAAKEDGKILGWTALWKFLNHTKTTDDENSIIFRYTC